MAALASPDFLQQLKSIYPARGDETPEDLLTHPWYLVAAVAFSASNEPAARPIVFEFALNDLKRVQTTESPEQVQEQRMRLASKMREALLQTALLCGLPRAIESLVALQKVTPEELCNKRVLRDRIKTIADYEESGERLYRAIYGDTADYVQSLLFAAYPDLAWFCTTVAYGINAKLDVLTQAESSYAIVAALIATNAGQQTGWHLKNVQNSGATPEEVRAIREIAMKVAEKAGVKWSDGVPEVI